jgi:hypothetical protein
VDKPDELFLSPQPTWAGETSRDSTGLPARATIENEPCIAAEEFHAYFFAEGRRL